MRIGIFYGSTTGNTQNAATMISEIFGSADLFDISTQKDTSIFANYDLLIFGTSTWGDGDLQDDWDSFVGKLKKYDFTNQAIALFGLGDQDGYGHEFISSLRQLYDIATKNGAKIIGSWSVDGYEFESSQAVIDNQFIGLALDEDNQSDMTKERIKLWVGNLKQELGI